MPTLSPRFLWFLLSLLTTLSTAAIGFFTNILTADATKLWNPENRWLWLVLAGLILMTTVLGYLAAQPSDQAASQPAAPSLDLRKRLLEALQIELKQRLEILHYDVVIAVGVKQQPEAVNRYPHWQVLSEVVSPDALSPTYTLTSSNTPQSINQLWNLFEAEGRRLLILGNPGAGKTITLLKLADQLLEDALFRRDAPIPVIFELSAWDGSALEEWLVKQLHFNYRMIAPATAKNWIASGALLPLMDGLDELVMAQQVECVRAINQFLQQKLRRPAVVCCCALAYQVQAQDHQVKLDKLNAAVGLQALSDGQIQQYLQQMQCPSLWTEIQEQPELHRLLEPEADGKPGLLRTPLFLSMLVIGYQGKPIRNQQELFEAYINQRLNPDVIAAERNRIRRKWEYAPGKEPNWRQTRHYLHWLANTLKQDGNAKAEFLIEELAPWMLQSSGQLMQYHLLLGLTFGLTVWLMSGLAIVRTHGGLSEMLTGGLLFGLTLWVMGWLPVPPLPHGTIFDFYPNLTHDRPNQGIWQSAKNVLILVALSYPALTAMFAVVALLPSRRPAAAQTLTSQETLIGLIPCALLVGFLYGGGIVLIQHLILRWLLYQQGVMPWNYAQFLNYCAERRLLQRIGGRYRFIHRLLMEHFATMGNGEWGIGDRVEERSL